MCRSSSFSLQASATRARYRVPDALLNDPIGPQLTEFAGTVGTSMQCRMGAIQP
jgi:hypothetical protein